MFLGAPFSVEDHQAGAVVGSMHQASSLLLQYSTKFCPRLARMALVVSLVPPPFSSCCRRASDSTSAFWCTIPPRKRL